MLKRVMLATSVLALLLGTGCTTQATKMGSAPPGGTRNQVSAVSPQEVKPVNVPSGMWGSQPIVPTETLILVNQGDMIGRRAYDANAVPLGTVDYVLADPATNATRYVAIRTEEVGGNYLLVPISVVRTVSGSVQVETPVAQINQVPRYTLANLGNRLVLVRASGPVVATAAAPVIVAPAAPGAIFVSPGPGAVVMPVAPAFPGAAAGEQIYLSKTSDLVGRAVVDSRGQPIGTVDYIGVSPVNGSQRYAVISGPMFGPGNYVFVPTSLTHVASGMVVVDTPASTLMQAQRFQAAELRQFPITQY